MNVYMGSIGTVPFYLCIKGKKSIKEPKGYGCQIFRLKKSRICYKVVDRGQVVSQE